MNFTQRGSVFAYVLAAIMLMGVLIITLTGGPQKSALTGQLDSMVSGMYGDLTQIQAVISDCTLNYAAPVDFNASGAADATDNPNAPFPLYNSVWNAATSYGSAGTAIANITCPGAPGLPKVMDYSRGRGLGMLSDTSTWTVNYRNDTTEGVLLRITPAAADPVWDEAASRINLRYSACKAFAVKDGAVDGGACTNGCLFVWILRRASSVIGTADGGGVTCPPA